MGNEDGKEFPRRPITEDRDGDGDRDRDKGNSGSVGQGVGDYSLPSPCHIAISTSNH